MWMLGIVVAGFFAGAIPFGFLIARRRGLNIKEHGSGNIGATNVARVLGARVGLIVLLLDAAKGAIPTFLAMHYCGWPEIIAATGAAAILGHCFSPFLAGKGGKGVATSFGVFLVIAPSLAGLAVLAFVVIWRITRVPALGSLAGSAALSALFIARGQTEFTLLACATTALLVYTHRSNLAKLTNPRE
ncbi:MAG: glycerol-3-phosphate acyltransferase [Myxococcota bacterium]|nr:glycerol-3-phosphate acyltransferase [Deltaproteobacteria bacterium]MDQ3338577.1 glycerol-3-phosphate acyltransferase [Myxococcota bacterium]